MSGRLIGDSLVGLADALSRSYAAMNPFVRTLVNKLPNQSHKKAIVVDEHLRVKGSPLGTVYCIGDAATASDVQLQQQGLSIRMTELSRASGRNQPR